MTPVSRIFQHRRDLGAVTIQDCAASTQHERRKTTDTVKSNKFHEKHSWLFS